MTGQPLSVVSLAFSWQPKKASAVPCFAPASKELPDLSEAERVMDKLLGR